MLERHGDRIDSLPRWLSGSVAAAAGLREREDPALPRTGGPAGNARLTAWTGALLLVVLAAEGATLLDVHGMISWHVALGALAIPPVVLKISSTGWRMLRYYAGAPAYRTGGPPPALMRALGPLVVVSTIALLATGVVLVLLGQDRSRTHLLQLGGFGIDWIWLHQASFAVWVAVMTLHVLGRALPGLSTLRRAVGEPGAVAGIGGRALVLALAVGLGVVCALLLVGADASWAHFRHDFHHDFHR